MSLIYLLNLSIGTSIKKQVEGIFEIVGTPDEASWPNIDYDLRCCSLRLPTFPGRDLRTMAPRLDDRGIDLLQSFLKCNPNSRISACSAMIHPYFDSLPAEIHGLPESYSIFSLASVQLSRETSDKTTK